MPTSFEPHEKRPGYYVVRRVHPLTPGKTLTKQSRNKLVLELWAREIESVSAKFKAGVLNASQVVSALAKLEGESITVGEAWAEFMDRNMSENSRTAYSQAWDHWLREHFETKKLVEVTERELVEWESKSRLRTTKRGKPPADRTIAFAWNCLKSCLARQKRAGRLEGEPWGSYRVAVPDADELERETLRTSDEMFRLVKAAAEFDEERSKYHFGDLAVRLVLLLLTGLRNAELGALGWDDVMVRAGIPVLRVRWQVQPGWRRRHPEWERPKDKTKNKRMDEIPLHPDAVKALKAQRVALERATYCPKCSADVGHPCEPGCTSEGRGYYRPDGPIFPGRRGNWRLHPKTLSSTRVRELVRLAVPEADAERFVVHSTRHTMASFALFACGGDLRRAMKLTRHRDVEVFQKYMHRVGRDNSSPLPELGLTWGDVLDASPEPLKLEMVNADGWRVASGDSGESDEVNIENECKVDVEDAEDESSPGSLMDDRAVKLATWREDRKANRRNRQNELDKRYKASNATDFDTAYAAWVVAGRPGVRPFQVTAGGRRVYDKVRKYEDRTAPENPKFKVPRDVRKWEKLVEAIKMLKEREEHDGERSPLKKMPQWVEELRVLNPGIDKLRPGLEVIIPREWHAGRLAMKAKWRYFGAWAKFLQDRDASRSQVAEMIQRKLPESADAEDEGDDS